MHGISCLLFKENHRQHISQYYHNQIMQINMYPCLNQIITATVCESRPALDMHQQNFQVRMAGTSAKSF